MAGNFKVVPIGLHIQIHGHLVRIFPDGQPFVVFYVIHNWVSQGQGGRIRAVETLKEHLDALLNSFNPQAHWVRIQIKGFSWTKSSPAVIRLNLDWSSSASPGSITPQSNAVFTYPWLSCAAQMAM